MLSEGCLDRIHNPNDWLRREIRQALQSNYVKVIPILVDGFEMPKPDDLPSDIQALVEIQGEYLLHQLFEETLDRITLRVHSLLDEKTESQHTVKHFLGRAYKKGGDPVIVGWVTILSLLVAVSGISIAGILTATSRNDASSSIVDITQAESTVTTPSSSTENEPFVFTSIPPISTAEPTTETSPSTIPETKRPTTISYTPIPTVEPTIETSPSVIEVEGSLIITSGESRETYLNSGEIQEWLLLVNHERHVSINLISSQPGNLDLKLEVKDSEGRSIATDDDSGGGLNPLIANLPVNADSQYTLIISNHNSNNGIYTISVTQID
jgi:hypothetical protein